ncbi:MAG: alpha/beta hydrolase [Candidatus Nanopelagicales bacterium]
MTGPLGPLILLHAFPVDNRLWEDVAVGLRAQGFEPIVPNLRGFGTNTDELPAEPDLDVLADDVAALITSADGGPAVVAGVSMGGYVAMNLARRHPELIAGLAFVDTKAGSDASAAVEGRLAFADRVEREGSGWVADAMVPNLISEHTMAKDATVEGRVREQIADCPPATIAWIQRAMAKRPDSIDVIDQFDGPVLIIVGEHDLLSPPSEAVAMAEAAREATLVEVADAGHLTPIESPKIVTSVIGDWLRECFDSAATSAT